MKLCEAAKAKRDKPNQIDNNKIEDVVGLFSQKVLEPYITKKEGVWDTNIAITGNYESNPAGRSDNINIILKIKGENKKEEREAFNGYLDFVPDDVIVPFKSKKFSEEKAKNSGETTSVLFKWDAEHDKNVQINIAFSNDPKEMEYKANFVKLPIEKKNLLIGWTKAAIGELPEEQKNKILKRAGLGKVELKEDEKFEFDLSHRGLEIKKVVYKKRKDGTLKEISKRIIWTSSNWKDFLAAFPFDIEKPFHLLVKDMKKYIKNKDSKERIFKSYDSDTEIKTKEVETPDGRKKLKSKEIIKKEFGISEKFSRWIDEN